MGSNTAKCEHRRSLCRIVPTELVILLPLFQKRIQTMTEAALVPESPQAPSVIRLLLNKLGVAYEEVLDHHGLNASRKVQAVLLDDAVGALMVLFPQSQLLDLNRLAELTGRRLTAVSTERLERCSANTI